MPFEFKLPDIGEGVVEGEIVSWLVKEGDRVGEDQPLVEVMTDKATVEIHSPRAGVITRRLGKEGETIPVGSTLVVIEEGDSSSARPLATPGARRLARQMGIDLADVSGSGHSGQVTKEDLQTPAGTRAPERISGEERLPLRGLRKRIAERMVRSKRTAAHFGFVEEIDVSLLVKLREEAAAARDAKLTFLPYFIKAAVAGLKKYPLMNASLDEETQEIRLKKEYNIGVAVGTEQGLVVPVIKEADNKSIWDIAGEIRRLAEEARSNSLKLEDLQGSTFTITSLGLLGGVSATPIINYPEVAIMGVHRIRVLPRFVGDAVVPRHMMNISLSVDHRVLDGLVAAQFAAELRRLLESPALL